MYRKARAGAAAVSEGRDLSLDFPENQKFLDEDELVPVNWIIGGPRGAASKLGLNLSTLRSKMSKLGINRPS